MIKCIVIKQDIYKDEEKAIKTSGIDKFLVEFKSDDIVELCENCTSRPSQKTIKAYNLPTKGIGWNLVVDGHGYTIVLARRYFSENETASDSGTFL